MSLIQADARRIPLVDGCVQCCVSSPPYFGLRDYGVAGQIGLEPSPDAYVAQLVAVYREVWRVLRDDGVIFVNLGDSYAASGMGGNPAESAFRKQATNAGSLIPGRKATDGLKPKDLIGVPWRVAFALQADGWYLRSDIIWAKPNPMPESVTDRPTKAHEYIFLLSKSERYFYDAEAISELASDAMVLQVEQGYNGAGTKDYEGAGVQNPSSVKARIIANARKRADRFGGNKHNGDTSKHSDGSIYTGRPTRNARSVWSITTKPYPGAHFATMPERLAERCILAGSRPGDLVFDPFGGSGTTVRVARKFNRRGVMLDLNPAYLKLAEARISGVQTDLFEVPA